jgi:hypothetical protein
MGVLAEDPGNVFCHLTFDFELKLSGNDQVESVEPL